MCPACIATMALWAGGATTVGGLAAIVLWKKKSDQPNPTEEGP